MYVLEKLIPSVVVRDLQRKRAPFIGVSALDLLTPSRGRATSDDQPDVPLPLLNRAN